jgi:Ca-activated chloride channel family protein
MNNAAGRNIVDLASTQSIARTWIGIVTYREMAECLGWPNKEIGFADIVALRSDPRGWASYSCAKAEWGRRPLVAYTDPDRSSTGRSVLFTLYSIASRKSPDNFTLTDVRDPEVVGYVSQFQRLVDHYLPTTLALNTKVHLGQRFGHFFLMPEDNLIHLYEGTETAVINGVPTKAPPISKPMVMIYPKEGSTEHNHSASFVNAPWVTPDQTEAARMWVDYLHEDQQQGAFLRAGFRPSTAIPLSDPISGRYGLDPSKPTVKINPDRIDQVSGQAIVQAWDDVKRPAAVTLVADVSGSMSGVKLQEAKKGLTQALDAFSKNNHVGLVTFSDSIVSTIPIGPIAENRFTIAEAVEKMRAQGGTGLYDAIKAGIEMSDAAGLDDEAPRGVVVLTDGRANNGKTALHDLITMMSRSETPIETLAGFEADNFAVEQGGRQVSKSDVHGTALKLSTRHRVYVFFIGIGSDADMDVGRLLAEATGAGFQGATEQDLAKVIEEFGKYF